MTLKLDQIRIVSVITKEVCRQFKAAGEKSPPAMPYQFQAVIDAANLVVAAFEREEVKAAPGAGLDAWLTSDDRGLSSETICRRLFGKPQARCSLDLQNSHPRDPDDFGRCHRFLEAVPEARARFHLMKDVSPVWKKLVEEWDELTELYLKELPGGRAPILYERMEQLGC
jgi:hypothetical protein